MNLIGRDAQDHDGQFGRINDAGFHYTSARGNVFSYGDDGLNGHAALTSTGAVTTEPVCRPDVGTAWPSWLWMATIPMWVLPLSENPIPIPSVGPFVITGNYCLANTGYDDHFNTFLVGTVWRDINRNNRYDPGEGVDGVSVTPDSGSYYAVTGEAGGYAFPVTAGSYETTFHGDNLAIDEVKAVTVSAKSVLLDLKVLTTKGTPAHSFPWPLFLPAIQNRNSDTGQSDCNGIMGGSAYLDHCNRCVGGNTGKTACVQDCNGVWGRHSRG